MIENYYEPFRKLTAVRAEDGMGGADVKVMPGAVFAAGLCRVKVQPVMAAEQRRTRMQGVLAHPKDVMLDSGKMIRRERDGAIFRVISDSSDVQTPAGASVFFAQTTVERLVNAHDDLYDADGAA